MIIRSIFFNLCRPSYLSINNNLITKFATNPSVLHRQRVSFSDITKPNEDELTTYEHFLLKFNQSIRKPHEKMRAEEERIIQKYLN